jgi:hypothetical protein
MWLHVCQNAVEVFKLHYQTLGPDTSDLRLWLCAKIMSDFRETMQRINLMNPSGHAIALCYEDVRDIRGFLAMIAWSTGTFSTDHEILA